MKVFVAIWLLAIAARAATLVVEPASVHPGQQFTLGLWLDETDVQGVSLYVKSNATFAILGRTTDFPDLTTPDSQLGSISTLGSTDLGGLWEFDAPTDRPLLALTLTLEAPATPGSCWFIAEQRSVLLFADFSTAPLVTPYVQVDVVPEPSSLLLLGCLGFTRLRPAIS